MAMEDFIEHQLAAPETPTEQTLDRDGNGLLDSFEQLEGPGTTTTQQPGFGLNPLDETALTTLDAPDSAVRRDLQLTAVRLASPGLDDARAALREARGAMVDPSESILELAA